MINFKTNHKALIADRITPVSIYLSIRDRFPMAFLLESSDYHGQENSMSYICFDPVAEFTVIKNTIHQKFPGQKESRTILQQKREVMEHLHAFRSSFNFEKKDVKCLQNGLFGFMAYDAVNFYETIEVKKDDDFPSVHYKVFRYVIAVDHFHNELHLFEHLTQNQESNLQEILDIINRKDDQIFPFRIEGDEESFTTDEDFLETIQKGIQHCHRGDVFQVVLSRRYGIGFSGDDFNVYRALRSINPSPYLFYFDFGNFRIFGSSPEAQLVVKDHQASIFPIAGTFRRTGKDSDDAELAKRLQDDKKENAEHVMLVDLARNDLSRCAEEVGVEVFKEIQYYSHVIHLVSKVTGTISKDQTLPLVASTFPAGTLSGAPKFRAMELIDQYESSPRGYYGGAAGYLAFDGDFNHAIMIRSFYSRSGNLYYQAGAGVVAQSVPQLELEEVDNKLNALRKALQRAQTL